MVFMGGGPERVPLLVALEHDRGALGGRGSLGGAGLSCMAYTPRDFHMSSTESYPGPPLAMISLACLMASRLSALGRS